jgi:hypothetical protein
VKAAFQWPEWVVVRALLIVCWRQGVVRSTRWAFWHHLVHILMANPGVAEQYLAVCAHNEHFLEYRDLVRLQIESQLATYRRNLEQNGAGGSAAPAEGAQQVTLQPDGIEAELVSAGSASSGGS